MDVRFVSQASLIVETEDAVILTDPWLHGKAFNESWALFPEAAFPEDAYGRITHLWISHEHPDHFHVPTLRSLPEDFKQRVEVLFQRNNSTKVFEALRKFGYRNFTEMPHREWIDLTPQTRAYCAQIGNMDSCLAVESGGAMLLNLNDCECNGVDCRMLRRDIGPVDVLLNQFSLAGYSGEADRERYLKGFARQTLIDLRDNHRDLEAGVTIPIASNIYFCKPDNCYINAYGNTPQDVADFLSSENVPTVILYPGDTWTVGAPHDSGPALQRFRELYDRLPEVPIDPLETVPLEEVEAAFHQRLEHLQETYPSWVLRRLSPVLCHVPDHAQTIRFSIPEGTWERVDVAGAFADVEINSQPLHFTFRWPWGMQTLGVSGRLILRRNEENWRRHRILFAMDNAEVYLKPQLLFTRQNVRWVRERFSGMTNQVRYQLQRMRGAA